MPYVEFYKLKNDGAQDTIAVCRLENHEVICEGDEDLIKHLTNTGIIDYRENTQKNLFPSDGLIFLEQLSNNFHSGYLNASEVKE